MYGASLSTLTARSLAPSAIVEPGPAPRRCTQTAPTSSEPNIRPSGSNGFLPQSTYSCLGKRHHDRPRVVILSNHDPIAL